MAKKDVYYSFAFCIVFSIVSVYTGNLFSEIGNITLKR